MPVVTLQNIQLIDPLDVLVDKLNLLITNYDDNVINAVETVNRVLELKYDNTIVGLEDATTVQEAIDSLVSKIDAGFNFIGKQASFDRVDFTCTQGQTVFTLEEGDFFNPGFIQVYLDGVLLNEEDFVTSEPNEFQRSNQITLNEGAELGQTLSIIVLDSLELATLLRVLDISPSSKTDSIKIDNSGNVVVDSELTFNSGIMQIDHPLTPGAKLRQGAIVGDETALYFRGHLMGSGTISLPSYWASIVDTNSITVDLTPRGSYQELYVESVQEGSVTINNTQNDPTDISAYFVVYGERKDIPALDVQ